MNREFEHKNEWALVLGGSSGLGLATAKKTSKTRYTYLRCS